MEPQSGVLAVWPKIVIEFPRKWIVIPSAGTPDTVSSHRCRHALHGLIERRTRGNIVPVWVTFPT
jgi:hypothetical protein